MADLKEAYERIIPPPPPLPVTPDDPSRRDPLPHLPTDICFSCGIRRSRHWMVNHLFYNIRTVPCRCRSTTCGHKMINQPPLTSVPAPEKCRLCGETQADHRGVRHPFTPATPERCRACGHTQAEHKGLKHIFDPVQTAPDPNDPLPHLPEDVCRICGLMRARHNAYHPFKKGFGQIS